MGKVYDVIPDHLQEFILNQHLFFVGTAPLSADGRVNISPKGLDCFRILSESQVAYLDLTGSGNETSAHLMENGRITFMFCSFEGYPNIVRLYGEGQVILPGSTEWEALSPQFSMHPAVRQIIVADLDRVSTSCGHGVPLYDYVEDRDLIMKWAAKKGEQGLIDYRAEKNVCSIDGLPTLLGVAIQITNDKAD